MVIENDILNKAVILGFFFENTISNVDDITSRRICRIWANQSPFKNLYPAIRKNESTGVVVVPACKDLNRFREFGLAHVF
jgi:hypothetical protein